MSLVFCGSALAAAPEGPLTEKAEPVTNTTAVLHGTVNPQAKATVAWFFEYNKGGVCTGGSTTPVHPAEEVQAQPVEAPLSGLQPGKEYTFCLVARNEAEEVTEGKPVSFTTTAAAPTVGEPSVSSVGTRGAVASAKVNANEVPTTYYVDYGTTASYGYITSPVSIGSPSAAIPVNAELTGLQPDTVYHLRFVASNELGTGVGSDISFRTYSLAGVALPDERGFELIPPINADANVFEPTEPTINENDNGPRTEQPLQASADGHAVTYAADPPTSGGNGNYGRGTGNQSLATRTASAGWTSTNILPNTGQVFYQAFSKDLTVGILDAWSPLAAEIPTGYDILYSHRIGTDRFPSFFTTTPPNRSPEEFGTGEGPSEVGQNQGLGSRPARERIAYAGGSANFEHLLFEANDALTVMAGTNPPEPKHTDLYDSVAGVASLVNVLPSGAASSDATFGALDPTWQGQGGGTMQGPNFTRVISADGSHVFWTDLNTETLYVRESGSLTRQLDATRGPGPSGGGRYWTASDDGSRAYFTDCSKLTPDSTAVSAGGCGQHVPGSLPFTGNDLYEWHEDLGSHAVELTDLTVDHRAEDPLGADVQAVVGASGDGSYVYFLAKGALTPEATHQSCEVESAGSGCNLYVRHSGEPPKLVAVVSGLDLQSRSSGVTGVASIGYRYRKSALTPDGRHLVFESYASLTGYDNRDASGEQLLCKGGKCPEVYIYDATQPVSAGNPTCVSCNPSRVRPSLGGAFLSASYSNTYQQRWVSADGTRVFFDSVEALVPQDVNGKVDVYEWEQSGAGTCLHAGGCIYLLSGGESPANSFFLDASESGNDVFIVTRAKLLPQDQNANLDLYDVRVGAPPPLTPPVCAGTRCQGAPPTPPPFATPPSVTFAGTGNFSPAPSTNPGKPATTAAEKLHRALVACRKGKNRRKRALCKARARRRYPANKVATTHGRVK